MCTCVHAHIYTLHTLKGDIGEVLINMTPAQDLKLCPPWCAGGAFGARTSPGIFNAVDESQDGLLSEEELPLGPSRPL